MNLLNKSSKRNFKKSLRTSAAALALSTAFLGSACAHTTGWLEDTTVQASGHNFPTSTTVTLGSSGDGGGANPLPANTNYTTAPNVSVTFDLSGTPQAAEAGSGVTTVDLANGSGIAIINSFDITIPSTGINFTLTNSGGTYTSGTALAILTTERVTISGAWPAGLSKATIFLGAGANVNFLDVGGTLTANVIKAPNPYSSRIFSVTTYNGNIEGPGALVFDGTITLTGRGTNRGTTADSIRAGGEILFSDASVFSAGDLTLNQALTYTGTRKGILPCKSVSVSGPRVITGGDADAKSLTLKAVTGSGDPTFAGHVIVQNFTNTGAVTTAASSKARIEKGSLQANPDVTTNSAPLFFGKV